MRADPSVLDASTITCRFKWMPHLTQTSLVTTYHESEAQDNRGIQCEMGALEIEENTITYWLSVHLTMWITGRKCHVSLNLLQITQALELWSFLTLQQRLLGMPLESNDRSPSHIMNLISCISHISTSHLILSCFISSSDFDNVELREHQVLCSAEYRGQKFETAEGWWGSAGHQGETISVHGKLTFCKLYHFTNGYILGTSWWVRAKLDMTLHWNCFSVYILVRSL